MMNNKKIKNDQQSFISLFRKMVKHRINIYKHIYFLEFD